MQERPPLNLGKGAAKRTHGKGTRRGIRRVEEIEKTWKKEESEKGKIWSAKRSERLKLDNVTEPEKHGTKNMWGEVNKKKNNKEGFELAMKVEKQTNEWQGKRNNVRIRSCIWAILQGAKNLGTETLRRKEPGKRHRKGKRQGQQEKRRDRD